MKTDRNAIRRADQMQAPAEELLLFGGAVAAIGSSAYLFTASGAYPPANRYGQAIDDKDLTAREDLAQRTRDELQPVREFMQAAIKACDISPAREIVTFAEDTHRTFVMILKVLGRSNGEQDDLRIWHLRAHITLVAH